MAARCSAGEHTVRQHGGRAVSSRPPSRTLRARHGRHGHAEALGDLPFRCGLASPRRRPPPRPPRIRLLATLEGDSARRQLEAPDGLLTCHDRLRGALAKGGANDAGGGQFQERAGAFRNFPNRTHAPLYSSPSCARPVLRFVRTGYDPAISPTEHACYDHCYFNDPGVNYTTDRANLWSLP
jgi:hypothetical protein